MSKQRKPVENGEIKVEHGVPLPPIRGLKWKVFPLETMKQGDSFFVPFDDMARRYSAMQSVRNRALKLHIEVTVRTVRDGFRVWRVQ